MKILTGQLKVAKWDESAFLGVPTPQKAHEANITYKISGDLDGELTGKYVMIYTDDENASYAGAVRFEGQIGKKAGSFFLKEEGVFEKGIASTNWEVIRNSGTRDFSNIDGKGGFSARGHDVSYELKLSSL